MANKINEHIENLKQSKLKIKLHLGDTIHAKIKININNQELDKFKKRLIFTIGQEELFDGFDELIINKKIHGPLVLPYKFSPEYPDQDLAGKDVTITLLVDKIEKENKEYIFIRPKVVESENIEKEQAPVKNEYKDKYEESLKDIQRLKGQLELKEIELKININSLQEKAKTLQAKASEELKKALSENAVKIEKEKAEIKQFALQNFLEDFIIPFNNFELAINSAANTENQAVKNYVVGFNMIKKQFESMLEDNKIEIIKPNISDEFLPEEHNVIDTINNEEFMDNAITKVNMNGFKLNGRVVKPAQVTINKK
ncbi:nucleotide exchange factor GrpE [Mycoplasmopsis alligatoris]|uniref:Protein GrpE n=1 Tax=Mycoplasmopsis alligatoris A21JP2 TaxID=747682 RepID=D4XW67_9BACT|nr:nucleotide exchange factor GrpE [Mycoplasmopsis alligatoris]EFF41425.1 co-chaperone GrpE [Mycoplasmopsis alligatoris A21JP2]